MKNSRRDVFKFAGGAVAGALLTPTPWRLITDSALWSENWPGIPHPVHGEIRTKLTNCALCPAGCAVRARCVGDQPVSLAGAQCPFGLTAHHLPYHPARLRQGPVAEATAALAGRAKEDRVAVLDLNPGRTASWTLRRSMGALNGFYIAAETNPVAYDMQAARTVLSVGAPLLEGWGSPANVIAARENFFLIHAGAIESPTAMLADEWIRIPAGGEEAFVASLPPAILRRLRENGPSLVIGDAPGIDELNRQLQAPAYARPEAPVPAAWRKQAAPITDLAEVPDHAIRYLLIDESWPLSYIPWHEIERTLVRENPVVVTFTTTRGGYARYATYALPTAMYPEIAEDIPAAIDQIAPVFRLAVPLVPAPAGVTSAAEVAGGLAGVSATTALRERAAAIDDSEAFWKSLNEGTVWRGAATRASLARQTTKGDRLSYVADSDLPLIAISTPHTPALLSPLMSKLYQESNLLLAPNAIALNPICGLAQGARAVLQTRLGKCAVQVTIDPAVPRDAVLTGSSPGIRDICQHASRAKVVVA